MWPKLARQIEVEIQQLAQLVDLHRPLIEQSNSVPPNPIELSAMAAMLHSFYTGIENIFKRIAVEIDEHAPAGPGSHQALLIAMTKPTSKRPAVVSSEAQRLLVGYMGFRHVFRHAYSFQLDWEKMAPLVKGCEGTFARLVNELGSFLRALDKSA